MLRFAEKVALDGKEAGPTACCVCGQRGGGHGAPPIVAEWGGGGECTQARMKQRPPEERMRAGPLGP